MYDEMTACEPFSDKATASTGSNQGNLSTKIWIAEDGTVTSVAPSVRRSLADSPCLTHAASRQLLSTAIVISESVGLRSPRELCAVVPIMTGLLKGSSVASLAQVEH
jgi:hypothetical protein